MPTKKPTPKILPKPVGDKENIEQEGKGPTGISTIAIISEIMSFTQHNL